jgi:hypothetical protein
MPEGREPWSDDLGVGNKTLNSILDKCNHRLLAVPGDIKDPLSSLARLLF